MLSLTLSLEKHKVVRPSLPRVLPSRSVLRMFFQTPIVVLVLQQREVTVPQACRQESRCEPPTGPGGLTPPEDVALAFLKCPGLHLLSTIHLSNGTWTWSKSWTWSNGHCPCAACSR